MATLLYYYPIRAYFLSLPLFPSPFWVIISATLWPYNPAYTHLHLYCMARMRLKWWW